VANRSPVVVIGDVKVVLVAVDVKIKIIILFIHCALAGGGARTPIAVVRHPVVDLAVGGSGSRHVSLLGLLGGVVAELGLGRALAPRHIAAVVGWPCHSKGRRILVGRTGVIAGGGATRGA